MLIPETLQIVSSCAVTKSHLSVDGTLGGRPDLGRDIDHLKSAITIAVSQPLVMATGVRGDKPIATWVGRNEDAGGQSHGFQRPGATIRSLKTDFWSWFTWLGLHQAQDFHTGTRAAVRLTFGDVQHGANAVV